MVRVLCYLMLLVLEKRGKQKAERIADPFLDDRFEAAIHATDDTVGFQHVNQISTNSISSSCWRHLVQISPNRTYAMAQPYLAALLAVESLGP